MKFANSKNTRGIEALQGGNIPLAIQLFQEAINESPRQPALHSNLAKALKKGGLIDKAAARLTFALALDPDSNDASLLSIWLAGGANPDIMDLHPRGLLSSINREDIDRHPIINLSTSYMKNNLPTSRAFQLGHKEDWETAAQWILSASGKAALGNNLFLNCLKAEPICDFEFENLLLKVRRALLLTPPKNLLKKHPLQDFIFSFIIQCKLNEYIYGVSKEEEKMLQKLRPKIHDPCVFCVLALYHPINSLIVANEKIEKFFPKPLAQLIREIIAENKAELELAKTFKTLNRADNKTSISVKAFYEETPYPRWNSVNLIANLRRSTLQYLMPGENLSFMDQSFSVLIAGCGTGQQLVEAAAGYGEKSDILAIDLSCNSLAYAARMATFFGFKKIEFATGDILGLDSHSRQFDFVECVGVLHHLEKPFVGWKKLLNKLKDGGYMRIGLYSKRARKRFNETKIALLPKTASQSLTEFRQARYALVSSAEASYKNALFNSPDFFTLSNARDLLSHISENPVTLENIADFIAKGNLEFVGFETSPLVEQIFDREEGNNNRKSLENWTAFEERHPEAFATMYLFWCRKLG